MNILRHRRFSSFPGVAAARAVIWTAVFSAAVVLFSFSCPASAAIGSLHSADAGAFAVPKDPDWAKYVLLVVIWTLVIAAVIGPMYRFLQRKKNPPDMIKYRGW